MKLVKILVIIGLIASNVIKTDYTPPCILDDLKRTSRTGSAIVEFFKNNAVSWQHSILANYIKTTKQVGNNVVQLVKKNIEILNYWDVKKENQYLGQELKTAQKDIKDAESIINDLKEKNQSLDQVLEISNKALTVKDTVIENNIKVINNLNRSNDERLKKHDEVKQAIAEIDVRAEKTMQYVRMAVYASLVAWVVILGYKLFQNWKKSKKKSKMETTNFSHI